MASGRKENTGAQAWSNERLVFLSSPTHEYELANLRGTLTQGTQNGRQIKNATQR